MLPKVSVITVNLNNAPGLQKTVDSVFHQTYANYEFLIIDGDSTDGSQQLIAACSDRLAYWVSESDRGIYHAMNKGLAQATGDYCLFLNSGDWLIDNNVLDNCFQQPHTADLLIGPCRVLQHQEPVFTSVPDENLSLWSFYQKTIPHQTTFIKRALFERLGPYCETYGIHGDYEFWIRAVIQHHCSVETLTYVVADYNLDGLSAHPAYQAQSRQEVDQILRRAFPERILTDYAHWKEQETEMQIMEWVKSKKPLYQVNKLVYSIARRWVAFRKAFGA